MLIFIGVLTVLGNCFGEFNIAGFLVGFLIILIGALKDGYKGYTNQQNQNIKYNRFNDTISKMGGSENIDIDLSDFSNINQLIVLKDSRAYIGYNNFDEGKIYNFKNIISIDMIINNYRKQTEDKLSIVDAKYSHEYIKSINVYIHTTECTEELIYSYSDFNTSKAQQKYSEVVKLINRFKVLHSNYHETIKNQ